MHLFRVRMLTTAALLLATTTLFAQWRPVNSYSNLNVSSIVERNDTILAGTGSGVYRSFDAGASWTRVNTVQTSSIAQNDSFLFAGMNGLCRSSDHGDTWETQSLYGFAGLVISMAVHHSTVLALMGDAMYRSADNGKTWRIVDSSLGSNGPPYIMMGPVNNIIIDSGTWYAVGGTTMRRAYRSTDDGTSWTFLSSVPDSLNNHSSVTSLIAHNGSLFASVDYNGVQRSDNGGRTWAPVNNGLNYRGLLDGLFTLGGNDTMLYTSTLHGLYQSRNNGELWTPLNPMTVLSDSLALVNCYAFEKNAFSVGTSGGIYRTSDNGSNWDPLNAGFSDHFFTLLSGASVGSHVLAVGSLGQSSGFLAHSSNEGVSWESKVVHNSSGRPGLPRVISRDSGNIVIGTDSYLSGPAQICVSRDSGHQWATIADSLWTALFACTFEDSRFVGIAVRGSHLLICIWMDQSCYPTLFHGPYLVSHDYGVTWSVPRDSLMSTQEFTYVGDTLIGLRGDGSYHSTDYGESWQLVSKYLPAFTVVKVFVDHDTLYSVTHDFAQDAWRGLSRSIDLGRSWMFMNTGLPDSIDVRDLASGRGKIIAATDSGVFISTTGGALWQAKNDGLPSIQVTSVAIAGNYAFTTTSNGIYRRSLNELIVDVQQSAKPESPSRPVFFANYPNPFSDATTINYALPHAGRVSLTVCNALGEIVLSVSERQEAGRHQKIISTQGFQSGVYAVRMAVNGSVCSRMVEVVK